MDEGLSQQKKQREFIRQVKNPYCFRVGEVYTGVLTQGRQTTPNYMVKTWVMKLEDEWVKVENTHEPIVSKKDFDLVQEILKAGHKDFPR